MKVVSNIDLNSTAKGINLNTPGSNQDSANKEYVDTYKSSYVPATVQIFTSGSGTWNKPTGCKFIKVTAIGGGGSGGVADCKVTAGGGGGGGTVIAWIDVTSISSYSYSVGSGGSVGNAGNNTTFGENIVANGGGLGGGGNNNLTNRIYAPGGSGGSGTGLSSSNSIVIRGGTGGHGTGAQPVGGSSYLATNKTYPTNANNSYGGGGGGIASGGCFGLVRGYAGSNGIIIVEEFY